MTKCQTAAYGKLGQKRGLMVESSNGIGFKSTFFSKKMK